MTVGTQLREAREARGLSLHQVADILRLRASQVHALEEGNFNSLPGQTFVTGFLRSYANLLDLDAVAIVELYKHEEGGGLRVPSLAFPEPTTGGRMPGAGILLGTLVIALILLAGWFLYQESESLDFERVAELPEHLASKIKDLDVIETDSPTATDKADDANTPPKNMAEILKSSPTTGTPVNNEENTTGQAGHSNVAAAGSPDTIPQPEANFGVTEAPDSNTTVAATPPQESSDAEIATTEEGAGATSADTAEVTSSASAEESVEGETDTTTVTSDPREEVPTPAAPQETEITANYPQDTLQTTESGQAATATEGSPESPMPRTFGVENTDARVVLRATEESWVQVKAEDDNPVLSQILKPGDIYMAPNTPDLKLTTGNAGGLEIRVDGKEIKSLGGTGAIVREIPLAADSLLENNGLQ